METHVLGSLVALRVFAVLISYRSQAFLKMGTRKWSACHSRLDLLSTLTP
jgi:hypothetical protein